MVGLEMFALRSLGRPAEDRFYLWTAAAAFSCSAKARTRAGMSRRDKKSKRTEAISAPRSAGKM